MIVGWYGIRLTRKTRFGNVSFRFVNLVGSYTPYTFQTSSPIESLKRTLCKRFRPEDMHSAFLSFFAMQM